MQKQSYTSQLQGYLEDYHITVTDEMVHQLIRHLELVIEKNKFMNLTRITDPGDGVVRHIVDSLLCVPSIHQFVGSSYTFVDVGTGAGFPGIPIGIVDECTGVLIDSVAKKVRAVNEFIGELGLSTRLKAEHTRAEDLARRDSGQYDVVLARAVADLGTLIEYASPLLRADGHLLVTKGRISDNEVQRGIATGKLVGVSYVQRKTYELPLDAGHREILTFCHDHPSTIKLPRKNGMAKSRPLVP